MRGEISARTYFSSLNKSIAEIMCLQYVKGRFERQLRNEICNQINSIIRKCEKTMF